MSIVPTGTNTNKGRLGRSLAILAALVVVLGLVAALFVHPNSPDRPQGPEATSPGSIAPQGGRQSPSPETASAGRDTGGAEIDRLTRELEARPDDVTLLVRLGQAWMRKADQAHPRRGRPGAGPLKAPSQPSSGRNPEEALSKAGEFLERALRVDPTSRAALQQMGELRLEQHDLAEARQRLREILTLNEEPIEAGADPVAVRAERAEQNARARMTLAKVESTGGDHPKALEILAPVIEGQPGNLEALSIKARILELQGRMEEALEALEVVARVGDQAQDQASMLGSRLERSRLFQKMGDKAAAIQELQKARTVAEKSGDIKSVVLVTHLINRLEE